jgi:hypothetical protein
MDGLSSAPATPLPPSEWQWVLVSQKCTMPRYYYSSLQPGTAAYRLLKLERSSTGISYQIVTRSLKKPPPYEAISYRWGSSAITSAIAIGDTYLGITDSIAAILKAMAPHSGYRYLWIDFVCINQEDLFEKDSQISLMREIYSQAAHVIAYLGDAPGNDNALLQDFLPRLPKFLVTASLDRLINQSSPTPFDEDPEGGRAMQRLLANDYWSRVWIIQELVLANSISILYGGSAMEWDLFSSAVRAIRVQYDGSWAMRLDMPNFHQLLMASNRVGNIVDIQELLRKQGTKLHLSDVVLLSSQSLCTNPEDKVNGLLGLSSNVEDVDVQPDHRRPVAQVYARVTLNGMRNAKFTLLNIAGLWRQPIYPLPSWVPDLSMPTPLYPLDNFQSKYHAGGGQEPQFRTLDDMTRLQIQGVLVDRIKAVSATPGNLVSAMPENLVSTMNINLQFLRAEGERHREFWRLAESHVPDVYFNGQSRDEALWRTLIGDEFFADSGIHFPAPEVLGKDYANFKRIFIAACEPDNAIDGVDTLDGFPIFWAPIQSYRRIASMMGKKSFTRRFAVTQKGFMCLVLKGTEVGDSICVFTGSKTAYVLRGGDGKKQKLVSEAYVHGFMMGEAMGDGYEKVWLDIE